MAGKLTSFETFRQLRQDRDEEQRARDAAQREGEARAGLADIARLVDDTGRLVARLQDGLKRQIGLRVARGELVDVEALHHLIRRYERLSWQLHGELRGVLERARRDG